MTELYVTEALDRVSAEEAGPGDIISVAGIPEITIGETLADADDPRPLPVISVDEPSLSVTVGTNDSPLSGQDGDKLTASQLEAPARPRAGRQRLAAGARRPSDPTSGRSRAAASWPWPSWWS